MLTQVISGGQTGVDQAALRAAKAAGLQTGGVAPKGWRTDAGPAPWLENYGLSALRTPGYPQRTYRNIAAANGTLIVFTEARMTGGTLMTFRACEWLHCTRFAVRLTTAGGAAALGLAAAQAAGWICGHRIRVLNVAGPRESKSPGIGEFAERYLAEVFRALAKGKVP